MTRRVRPHTAAVVAAVLLLGVVGVQLAGRAGTVHAAPAASGPTSAYRPIGPTRLADTREPVCGCDLQPDGTVRVQVTGRAGVPVGATAAAVTVTGVAGPQPAFVTVWPAGAARPLTSVLNLGRGATAANAAIVPLSADGAIDLWSNAAVSLVVDVSGVFVATTSSTDGRYVPITPERVMDSRDATPLAGGERRAVPRPVAVPADASAWVVNITADRSSAAGFVTVFPAGGAVPTTSVLNPDGTGNPVAASVIVPVSATGLELFTSIATDVIVDVSGWFTGPSAPDSADGLFVPSAPTRLLDTRADAPRLWGVGSRELALDLPGAAAVVTNLTVVEPDTALFVSAGAAGVSFTGTSNVNAPRRGAVVANAAITARSDRGLAWFANHGTDLVVDVTGWFTGAPTVAEQAPLPDLPPSPTVLLVGDSTLAALDVVTASQRALQGADFLLDAAPCRRLVQPSCRSAFTNRIPSTAVEAILAVGVDLDAVVVKAGYNEGSVGFRDSVVAVLTAARARRAEVVVWLTYSEGTRGQLRTYELNNAVLRELRDSGDWPELEVADWRGYAASSSGWYSSDRVHLQGTGAWATADYITRQVAHHLHRPCPQPWTPGEGAAPRCPDPDAVAAERGAPALRALYGF